MTDSDAQSTLEQARDATKRHAWREAFELLTAADASLALSADDLENLALAARCTGRFSESAQIYERACTRYSELEDRRSEARVALNLAVHHFGRYAQAVGAGWLSRAVRILAEVPESPEHGRLAAMQAFLALTLGQPDQVVQHARRAFEIGSRLGDRDVQALGLHYQGWALVRKGEVREGMQLLDEAMAAVERESNPFISRYIYCGTIMACLDLADYRRAAEWIEAAESWSQQEALQWFLGDCRVHRVQILRFRGAWAEAEPEARLACDECQEFYTHHVGMALYEIGEIRLRRGDFAGAEDAFRQAQERGWLPQPGLSLLRLAEGKVEAAAAAIQAALAGQPADRLARARLLPAQVEIAIAAEDLEAACSGTAEIEEIANACGSEALQASAQSARGALQLAQSNAAAALPTLSRAWRLWQQVGCPYEAARAGVLLATAHAALGDPESALLQLQAAKSTFERLGAAPDAGRAAELLQMHARETTAPSAAAPRVTRTFMFTDIVKSTSLLEAIGDEAWEDLLRWHDQTLRSLFAAHGGDEVKHAGDGFFVAFPDATQAAQCAVAIQRTLADHRRAHGFSPQVRIGLHAAEATRRGHDYVGRGVHQAARIAALADAGQILASQQTLTDYPDQFAISEARAVSLKGISQPVEVVAVRWR